MKLLFIIILLLSSLLMEAAVSKWLREPHNHLRKGLWFGLFPTYVLVTIFTIDSLLVSTEPFLLTAARNISMIFFLFSCMLFGLSIKFMKRDDASC